MLKINYLDYENLYSDLKGRLVYSRDYSENITINDGRIQFYNYNSAGYTGPGKIIFSYKPDQKLVYVFGGSSVVIPNYDEVFTKFLEARLKIYDENIKIINFGMDGIISESIKCRIEGALKNQIKPKLIILYTGHNDYNRIYHGIREKTSIIKKTFFPNIILEYIKNQKFKHYDFSEEERLRTINLKPIYIPYFTNIDWVVEPQLKKYLQKLKLIRFDNDYFIKYNELILKNYSTNIYDIIKLAQNHKIPIIIITPISNLEAEPFGINEHTSDIYQQALKEKNYAKRINYLQQAKDNDIFSGHTRTKSQLNDFLRTINEPDVYVLDLENELIKQNFSFTYNNFYDYVHLKPEAHNKISKILFEFIQKENLI